MLLSCALLDTIIHHASSYLSTIYEVIHFNALGKNERRLSVKYALLTSTRTKNGPERSGI